MVSAWKWPVSLYALHPSGHLALHSILPPFRYPQSVIPSLSTTQQVLIQRHLTMKAQSRTRLLSC